MKSLRLHHALLVLAGACLFHPLSTARAEHAPETYLADVRRARAMGLKVSYDEELRRRGDTEGVRKTVRLLIGTWPRQKENWLKRFPEAE